MGEKLKGRSKLKTARRPITTRDSAKKEQPKLGLLTEKNRRMVSFRLSNDLINLLEDLVKKYRTELYHRISKTDIIEAALLHASKMSVEDFNKMCADYGIEKKV